MTDTTPAPRTADEERIFVLAGNAQQARDAMRDFHPSRWRYVAEASHLMGIHGGTYTIVGTFWDRRDAPELYDRAQVAGLTTLAAQQSPPALDVERLTAILVDAENDDQMGVEYQPDRLAAYIRARLAEQPTPAPRTAAGQALYDDVRIHNQAQRVKADDRHDERWLKRILAIEAQAAPDTALREALERVDPRYQITYLASDGESFGVVSRQEFAGAISAALAAPPAEEKP